MKKLLLTLILILALNNVQGIGYIGSVPFFDIYAHAKGYELVLFGYKGDYDAFHNTQEEAIKEAYRIFKSVSKC